jgi:putative spermidine/putrescine transport system ATP-binding protein
MAAPHDASPQIASLARVHAEPGPGQAGLQDVSLTLRRGEILTLLDATPDAGITGAETALALFAGFARTSSGHVSLSGRLVSATPAHRRSIGFVQRDMALFPTHDVAGHAGFSPGVSSKRAQAVLERLGLQGVARARVEQLSPELRYRTALARALGRAPKLLLLEDPQGGLSADAGLKPLLRSIAEETGMAILHASRHVASTYGFSDRVGVLQHGWLHQIGPPQTLYDRPDSLTVAEMMGPLNRLPGLVLEIEDDIARIRLAGGAIVEARMAEALQGGDNCIVTLRPERIAVAALRADELGDGAVPVRLIETLFAGDQTRLRFSLDIKGEADAGPAGELVVDRPSSVAPPRGQSLCLAWQSHQAQAFRAAGSA